MICSGRDKIETPEQVCLWALAMFMCKCLWKNFATGLPNLDHFFSTTYVGCAVQTN